MNKQTLLLFFVMMTGIPVSLFAQSKNMTLHSNFVESGTRYNDIWGYVDDTGDEYAILGTTTQIQFVRVTTPSNPELVASFTPGTNTTWRDFKVWSHYAYAVSEGSVNEGLLIFDLCEISENRITQANQINQHFGKAHNIFIDVQHGRLYVVGTNTRSNGVLIYDLKADPANPPLIANVSLPGGYIHDIFVKDHEAYCSHGYQGMYVYDFTDAANPQLKATIVTGGYNHSSWGFANDSLLIYAEEVPTGLPLGIMDISKRNDNDLEVINLFKKPLLGPQHTNNTPHNPYMVGNYAVVSHYHDGVVIFDLTNPLEADTVAYFDTYPANTDYPNGNYQGCWGVYPFLPSGIILASDISNGLFVLEPTFSLPGSCNNGVQDFNEMGVDCGGACLPCEPCIREICGNGLDDDRNGLTDCEESVCECEIYNSTIDITVLLEGFYDPMTDEMSSDLVSNTLLPHHNPFKTAPWNYHGQEVIDTAVLLDHIVDWVLVEARSPENRDSAVVTEAMLLLKDGSIMSMNGESGFQITTTFSEIYLSVRHKSHLGIISPVTISLQDSTVTYDFSAFTDSSSAGSQKLAGNRQVCIAGDFDQNSVINNQDFNLWKSNSALVNQYVSWDANGDGVVNNQDFNLWMLNRSKIGVDF